MDLSEKKIRDDEIKKLLDKGCNILSFSATLTLHTEDNLNIKNFNGFIFTAKDENLVLGEQVRKLLRKYPKHQISSVDLKLIDPARAED